MESWPQKEKSNKQVANKKCNGKMNSTLKIAERKESCQSIFSEVTKTDNAYLFWQVKHHCEAENNSLS